MAKKKINQLDPLTPTITQLFAHANPSTGKGFKGTLGQLIALFTAQTPVKTYADEAALLANTDLVINYLAYVADSGSLYLYSGPTPSAIGNYILLTDASDQVGLWDDRGSFSAAGGAYPTSAAGGSGSAGAILKGDIWTISVAGTLPTGQVVEIGDVIRALIDTPGNTQANWAILQNNIGYVPLNKAGDTASGTITFTLSPIITPGSANQFVRTGASKELVTVAAPTQAEMLAGTETTKPVTPAALESKRSLKRKAVTFASATMTVDCELKEEVKFEDTTVRSSNFTFAMDNATNLEFLAGIILLTGTREITMPSTVRMLEEDSRWNNTTKILTLAAGTGSPFELSFDRMNGPIYLLKATSKYYVP